MNYTVLERDSFKVIGIRRIAPYGGGTWAIVDSDPKLGEKIRAYSGKYFDLGLCFGFREDGSNDYMCAVEWNGSDMDGFDSFTYTPATWYIFEAKGKVSDNVLIKTWEYINGTFLPENGFEKCAPTIEKYINWNMAEDLCHVEIHIPVKTK